MPEQADTEQQNTEQASAVEQAERVVAELETKHRALIERGQELGDARKRIAFYAHTGDKKAAAALDKLNTEAVRHGLDAENVLAAIEQAQERLADVRRAAAVASDQGNAREVAAVLDQLVEDGTEMDAALADVVTAGANLRAGLNRLHGLDDRFHESCQLS
jgi:hypothetical protein